MEKQGADVFEPAEGMILVVAINDFYFIAYDPLYYFARSQLFSGKGELHAAVDILKGRTRELIGITQVLKLRDGEFFLRGPSGCAQIGHVRLQAKEMRIRNRVTAHLIYLHTQRDGALADAQGPNRMEHELLDCLIQLAQGNQKVGSGRERCSPVIRLIELTYE